MFTKWHDHFSWCQQWLFSTALCASLMITLCGQSRGKSVTKSVISNLRPKKKKVFKLSPGASCFLLPFCSLVQEILVTMIFSGPNTFYQLDLCKYTPSSSEDRGDESITEKVSQICTGFVIVVLILSTQLLLRSTLQLWRRPSTRCPISFIASSTVSLWANHPQQHQPTLAEALASSLLCVHHSGFASLSQYAAPFLPSSQPAEDKTSALFLLTL